MAVPPATNSVFEKLSLSKDDFISEFQKWLRRGLQNAASKEYWQRRSVVVMHAVEQELNQTEVFAAAKRDEHLLRVDSTESFERVYALNFTKPPWMPRFMKRVVAAEAMHRAEDHEIILRNLEDLMLGTHEGCASLTQWTQELESVD